MTAHRLSPPSKAVTVYLDDEPIVADAGEPLAVALMAADRVALARSPKLHRPRGPSCLRGGCDGCTARVDGTPNVMTCLLPATDGARVETQNVVGSRTVDLLRVTDWFFPNGIDHHHFLAGVPGAGPLMQSIARRVAGLGLLPRTVRPVKPGRREEVDALVIGAGPSGIAAASLLASRGLSVILADDGLAPGGSLLALGRDAVASLIAARPLAAVDVRMRTVVAGLFGGEALLVSPDGASIVRPARTIIAAGAHDGVALFEGNDVPAVTSARAAALLAAHGVAIGKRIVLAGAGPFADALCRLLEGKADIARVDVASLVRAEGQSRLGGVVVRDGSTEKRLRADALAVELPQEPAFELCQQLGAEVGFDGHFRIACGDAHALGPSTWIAGQVRGLAFDPASLIADGVAAASAALG